MAHYAISMADGSVAIMQTIPRWVAIVEETPPVTLSEDGEPVTPPPRPVRTEVREATVEECIAKWPPAERAKVTGHRPIDIKDIPADRAYRNAWALRGGKIEHDMAKARDLHRGKLRAARAAQLAALDVAYQRADEVNDAKGKADIAANKQKLRDVTAHAAIDKAATVEELKVLTLEALTADPGIVR